MTETQVVTTEQSQDIPSQKQTGLNYFLEGDDETKRLEQQHPVIKAAMGQRLIMAPIDFSKKDMRVLDAGTSDGTWLLDFRKDIVNPLRNHSFTGFDLDAERFPTHLPSDTKLVEHDVLAPFPPSWLGSFDLVHQRLLIASAGQGTREMLKRELDLVKPGGWIQLIEAENICADEDGPVMRQFLGLITEIFKRLGCGVEFPRRLRGWLDEEGFVNTGDCLVPFSFGVKCQDESLTEQSVISASVAIAGLAAYGKTFDDLACMPKDDLDTLTDRFKEEMLRQGAWYPLRVVWGQKPTKQSGSL